MSFLTMLQWWTRISEVIPSIPGAFPLGILASAIQISSQLGMHRSFAFSSSDSLLSMSMFKFGIGRALWLASKSFAKWLNALIFIADSECVWFPSLSMVPIIEFLACLTLIACTKKWVPLSPNVIYSTCSLCLRSICSRCCRLVAQPVLLWGFYRLVAFGDNAGRAEVLLLRSAIGHLSV